MLHTEYTIHNSFLLVDRINQYFYKFGTGEIVERERERVCVCCDFTTTLVLRVLCFILQVVVILLQQHFILPGDLNEVLAESSSRGAA